MWNRDACGRHGFVQFLHCINETIWKWSHANRFELIWDCTKMKTRCSNAIPLHACTKEKKIERDYKKKSTFDFLKNRTQYRLLNWRMLFIDRAFVVFHFQHTAAAKGKVMWSAKKNVCPKVISVSILSWFNVLFVVSSNAWSDKKKS